MPADKRPFISQNRIFTLDFFPIFDMLFPFWDVVHRHIPPFVDIKNSLAL